MLKALATMVIITLFFLSSLAWTVGRLQDPKFLLERARDISLYGRLIEQLPNLLAQTEKPIASLSAEGQASVIASVVPAEEFYSFLDRYLTATLGYLTSREQDYSFRYSLKTARERAESAATDSLLASYHSLPDCQAKQLKAWSFDEELPICRLAGSSGQRDITSLANQLAKRQLEGLPEEIFLQKPSEKLVAMREAVSRFTQLFQLIWVATLILTLAYVFIWRRRAWFSLAVACWTVAVVEIAFSLIAWDWLAQNVGELISESQSSRMVVVFLDLMATVMEVMKTIFGNLAIGFLSAGAVFMILGMTWRPPRPTKLTQTPASNR